MIEIMKTNLDHFYGDYVVCATDRIYGEDDPVYIEMIKVLRQKGISEEDVFGLELPSGRTYILKRRV